MSEEGARVTDNKKWHALDEARRFLKEIQDRAYETEGKLEACTDGKWDYQLRVYIVFMQDVRELIRRVQR